MVETTPLDELAERLDSGDIVWVRDSYASGRLGWLRGVLPPTVYGGIGERLAAGDLRWVRTRLLAAGLFAGRWLAEGAVDPDGALAEEPTGRLPGPRSVRPGAARRVVPGDPLVWLPPLAFLVGLVLWAMVRGAGTVAVSTEATLPTVRVPADVSGAASSGSSSATGSPAPASSPAAPAVTTSTTVSTSSAPSGSAPTTTSTRSATGAGTAANPSTVTSITVTSSTVNPGTPNPSTPNPSAVTPSTAGPGASASTASASTAPAVPRSFVVSFDFGSSTPSAAGAEQLNRAIESVRAAVSNPVRVSIVGISDAATDQAVSVPITRQRAQTVRERLEAAIPPGRAVIDVGVRAETVPLDDPGAGRRVIIDVSP